MIAPQLWRVLLFLSVDDVTRFGRRSRRRSCRSRYQTVPSSRSRLRLPTKTDEFFGLGFRVLGFRPTDTWHSQRIVF
jgi:hypothetical protein